MLRETYLKKMSINNQNSKAIGTDIINVDTVRGCNNGCESCYAKRNCSLSVRHFDEPVLVELFLGKVAIDKYYRFGNFGDPATDWAHTERMVKGHGFDLEKSFFVTKLQNADGFSGLLKHLQVSIDPLIPDHFFKTEDNILKIMSRFPDTNIVLRVRSVRSEDHIINTLQQRAIELANENDLAVLETRIRFNGIKNTFDRYKLVPEEYSFRKGYLRPKFLARHLVGAKYHLLCDEYEKKCKGCTQCTVLLTPNWRNNWVCHRERNSTLEIEVKPSALMIARPRGTDWRPIQQSAAIQQ